MIQGAKGKQAAARRGPPRRGWYVPARTKWGEARFRAAIGQNARDVAGSGHSLDGRRGDFEENFTEAGRQRVGIADKGQGQFLDKEHLHVRLLRVKLNIVQKMDT
jgi:hypothetical protein